MQDQRGQYKLLKVDNTDLDDLLCVVKKYPEQKFLINGMYPNEVKAFTDLDNVRIGTSAIEGCDIYRTLVEKYPSNRFVFSTHTPLFVPEGNLFKIRCSSLSEQQRKWIGSENIMQFLA